MSAEDDVRKASENFYAALNLMLKGDAGPLADIWSHGATVTTMHPVGGLEIGWEKVKDTWEKVAKLASEGRVKLNDPLLQVSGEIAYEVGTEEGQTKLAGHPVSIKHRVTNIYRREGGEWKVVHHHTDVSPMMLDVLSRLPPNN